MLSSRSQLGKRGTSYARSNLYIVTGYVFRSLAVSQSDTSAFNVNRKDPDKKQESFYAFAKTSFCWLKRHFLRGVDKRAYLRAT